MSDRQREFYCDTLHLLVYFVALFFTTASFYIVKSVRSALILDSYGAYFFPYLWIISICTLTVALSLYSKLLQKHSLKTILALNSFFSILFLSGLSLFTLEGTAGKLISLGLYVWSDLFSVIMVEQLWTATNKIAKKRSHKKSLALVAAGGVSGALAGSTFAGFLGSSIQFQSLLLVSASLLAPIVIVLLSGRQVMRRIEKESAKNPVVPTTEGSIRKDFKFVLANRYLVFFAISLGLTQVVSTLIDFQFHRFVEFNIASIGGKTEFFGKFYMLLNIITLFILFITPEQTEKFRKKMAGLMVLPMANLIGITVLALFPVPLIVLAVKLIDKSLIYSVNKTSRESIYQTMETPDVMKAKSIIDIWSFRFSKLLCSLTLIPMISQIQYRQSLVNGFAVIAILGLIWSTLRFRDLNKAREHSLNYNVPEMSKMVDKDVY